MATLQELLMADFGDESVVKTASVNDTDELNKIAALLGLNDDTSKVAEEKETKEEEKEEEDKEDKKEEMNAEKVASIYDSLFPEDADLSKVASEEVEEKVAFEQALGAKSYDVMSSRFDKRILKMAAELAGGATVAASTAEDHDGNPHGDTTPPQAQKSNKPANAKDKIDTTPVYRNDLPAENKAETVGHFEQKHAAVMNAAFRKVFLLSQLEG